MILEGFKEHIFSQPQANKLLLLNLIQIKEHIKVPFEDLLTKLINIQSLVNNNNI
jgi:hypothetical protein